MAHEEEKHPEEEKAGSQSISEGVAAARAEIARRAEIRSGVTKPVAKKSENGVPGGQTLKMFLLKLVFGLVLIVLIGYFFLQALAGKNSVVAITVVIGLTSWMNIAKMVRTEVRQLRESEYLIAAKCMGGSFWHILRVHLLPNFVSSIMFMVVMNIRSAIIAESTLSFLGIGLPMEIISWGSMLSLSEKALMTNSWWIILIPGIFLVVTLLCITELGENLRKNVNQKEGNL